MAEVRYHVTKTSDNSKTGPIAVTTTGRQSCPDSCRLKHNGCYADGGPLAIHWNLLTAGQRGVDLEQHCRDIAAATEDGRYIRFNQAGDLPGAGNRVDYSAAKKMLTAAAGSRAAWTYTHKRDPRAVANLNRYTAATVNVSCNSLAELDRMLARGLPAVSLIPTPAKIHATPAGRRVVRCPAEYRAVDCASCGAGRPLCARKGRSFAVGFYPHGASKRKALAVSLGG